MKSVVFLALCAVGYALLIFWLLKKLEDISANPRKYDVIHGWDRYRRSFWYDSKCKRYGKHYYASLIVFIPIFMVMFWLYPVLGMVVQKLLLIPKGARRLSSAGVYIGNIAAVFFSIGLIQFFSFYGKWPVVVAARLYASGSDDDQPKAWKKMFLWMLVLSAICLPVMAVGINAYSYADQEKIVTHHTFSLVAEEIPYQSVESAATSYTSNEKCTEFSLKYTLTLKNGKKLSVDDFGVDGVQYIDKMLRKNRIPVVYGEMDFATYEQLKKNCDDEAIKLIESCVKLVG